jgi:hypothetical protein
MVFNNVFAFSSVGAVFPARLPTTFIVMVLLSSYIKTIKGWSAYRFDHQ